MKTTFELPDGVFRKAKSTAAAKGISLRQFFTDAIEDKLRSESTAQSARPWLKVFRGVSRDSDLVAEIRKAQKIIDRECEIINAEDWK